MTVFEVNTLVGIGRNAMLEAGFLYVKIGFEMCIGA